MKTSLLLLTLLINFFILKAQTAVYLGSNNAFGYCYGRTDVKNRAYNYCIANGGISPSLMYYTESTGYGAIYSGYNNESKLVIGVTAGFPTAYKAKVEAYNYCILYGGKTPQLVEAWNDFNPTANNNLGELHIKWAGVIDNGEGDKCPHGPTGSLHVLAYPASYQCPGDQKSYSGFYKETMLRGPQSGDYCPGFPSADREWLDGQSMQMNTSIYKWQYPDEKILIVIYEADPRMWKIPARAHDMLFCYQISRDVTLDNFATFGDYIRPAHDDAILNCRNAEITWYQDVWTGGLNKGIPSIFIQLITQY